MYRAMMLAALALVAGGAIASDEAARVDVGEGFAAQRAQILDELGDGETYSEITSKDRAEVQAALARITTALDNAGGVDRLTESGKVEVFNDQELVNNILTRAGDDSRLVCKRVRKTGSHMTSNQCMTVAARKRATEHAQETLRRTPSPSLRQEGM